MAWMIIKTVHNSRLKMIFVRNFGIKLVLFFYFLNCSYFAAEMAFEKEKRLQQFELKFAIAFRWSNNFNKIIADIFVRFDKKKMTFFHWFCRSAWKWVVNDLYVADGDCTEGSYDVNWAHWMRAPDTINLFQWVDWSVDRSIVVVGERVRDRRDRERNFKTDCQLIWIHADAEYYDAFDATSIHLNFPHRMHSHELHFNQWNAQFSAECEWKSSGGDGESRTPNASTQILCKQNHY